MFINVSLITLHPGSSPNVKKKKKDRKKETTASARAREIFHIIAGKLDSSAAAELHRFGSDEGIRTEDNVCLVCNGRGFTAVHGCN